MRVELYLDPSNVLNADVYNNSNNEKIVLKGKDIYKIISLFQNKKISNLKDNEFDLLIRYKDDVLIIRKYDKLLTSKVRELFYPILLGAKDFVESEAIKKTSGRKVKRTNKYDYKKMITIGLTALILTITSIGVIKSFENDKVTYIPPVTTSKIVDVDLSIPDERIYDTSKIKLLYNDDTESVNIDTDANKKYVSIGYEDRSSLDKAKNTISNYMEVIEKYSKIYGLDPKLVVAIATQESGDHYRYIDSGPAIGLMQIERNVWDGEELKAYNFDTNSWEKIIIDINELADLDYNVKVGCMIFQTNLKYWNYNILAALQSYNMGYGSMSKIINNYCADNGKTKEEVVNNPYDIGWINYRDIINSGDKRYLEHVLSYCGENPNIYAYKPDGEKVTICVNNEVINRHINL